MISNGTILGVASVKTGLLSTAIVLSVLFTLMKPEASMGLSFLSRLAFWSVHLGLAVLCILVASLLLRCVSVLSTYVFISIVAIGFLAAAIAAPLYVLVEQYLFQSLQIEDDWLDALSRKGGIYYIAAEYLEVLPIFLSSWIAINLPLLIKKPQLFDDGASGNDPLESFDLEDQCLERRRREENNKLKREQFLSGLPEVIGSDLVAVCSDLHYLNVYTCLGKVLVLGSLKNVVEFMGEEGVRVHRANWVAKKHVLRLVMKGNEAYCLMSTGIKIPVSRSKRKEVKALFGQSSVLIPEIEQPSLIIPSAPAPQHKHRH